MSRENDLQQLRGQLAVMRSLWDYERESDLQRHFQTRLSCNMSENFMQTTIELQTRHEQHLARWKQLGADRELAKLPYKIETDRLGRILMSPPPFFDHVRHVATIIELLHAHMPVGKALAETPVITSDGVKVTD